MNDVPQWVLWAKDMWEQEMKENKKPGRPKGSLNKNKKSPVEALVIPQELALKIKTLADKTGVASDRIALGSLVDGLQKWEGVHETLISYNESINTLIRQSGQPVRKHARRTASQTVSVPKSKRHAVAVEDTIGLQTSSSKGDNGADQLGTGAEDLSPYGHAIFGRGEQESGPRVDADIEQPA